ncbi:MAG: pilus (MSHA type) biogenesis protein MshL [Magnetococcales bacterium]|nr:pilus (MSHA type) biogenesis protein MshL [Magnetococcales bacterium]
MMKQAWMIGGIVCLALVMGGCKTGEMVSGNPGSGDTGSMAAAHKAVVEESAALERRREGNADKKGDKPGDKPLAKAADKAEEFPGWERTSREINRDAQHLSNESPDRNLHGRMVSETKGLGARNDQMRAMEHIAPPVMPAPVLPKYDRLSDIMVSLEMDKVDARQALRALAKQANLNLLLDPAVLEEAPLITVSFQKVSAATVLREVLRLADLHGVIEDNLLRVEPFQEVVIPLNFLETNVTSTFESGGDVLGAAALTGIGGGATGGGGAPAAGTGLKGGFAMTGGAKSTNPYEPIEKTLQNLVGEKKGTYQINRQTGTLYIRSKPSAVKSVTDLVQRYKEILGRQILIEARLMEVQLSDQYQAGINWALLRSNLALTSGITQTISTLGVGQGVVVADGTIVGNDPFNASANRHVAVGIPSTSTSGTTSALGLQGAKPAGLGLTLGGSHGLAFIDLLKQFGDVRTLSNPTIRARHGQPAMISVGQSSNYVQQTKVTAATVAGAAPTTEVTTATLFDGVMMGVVPFISTDGKITLSIHPIQSSLVSGSLDAKKFGASEVSLPQVNLKEISTLLELQDRDTVLLGGLIDKTATKYRTGAPVLSELPLLGRLFTHDQENETTRELVIMLRVTIL